MYNLAPKGCNDNQTTSIKRTRAHHLSAKSESQLHLSQDLSIHTCTSPNRSCQNGVFGVFPKGEPSFIFFK